jgi:deoxyuridine 5'-triphosphate nucleotidohydrolase
MSLKVKLLSSDASLPSRATSGSAGYDLKSCSDSIIRARERGIVKTGISIEFPSGHYARVAPRSGLTVKKGIDVGAGVIDEDYEGEICEILFNHSNEDFVITKGDRIAQLILEKISILEIEEVTEIRTTDRGSNGFGSSGV